MNIKTIGVLDGRRDRERRVALVPDTVRRLIAAGMSVIVESGAGSEAWYPDSAYESVGGSVAARADVLAKADILLAVGGPQPADIGVLRGGTVVIGILAPTTIEQLGKRGVVAVSLDRLPRTVSRAQSMDVLTSQASVAGYKAVLVAADAFGRYFPMFITAAGTSRPASVLVLGAGVAGLSAIGMARRLGAVVTGYDVRPETRTEVESLGAKFLALESVTSGAGTGGYARELDEGEQAAQQRELEAKIGSFDVVITTAQVPGRKPPLLVTSGALAHMRPGTVVVDLAASEHGGNVDGSAPGTTKILDPGVTIIGASDLPSSVPTASSDAYSQNMAAVIGLLVRDGQLVIDPDDPVQAAIVLTIPKEPTDEPVAAI